MAVYEHTYQPYAGALTPTWSRFLILPRHAYQDVFRSKLFTAFFALCFVCPLVMMILIYLRHNASALALMELNVADLVPINANFFRTYITIQGVFGFLLTVLIGPVLVSRDLANNALPLYFARPFSRAAYVLGKMSVLLILISAITWAPGLLLFLFQSYLEAGWFAKNHWIAGALLISSWTWMLLLALLSMALSAWVKWRLAASAALFAVYIIPNVIGLIIDELFRTSFGSLMSLVILIQTVNDALFRQWNTLELKVWMVPSLWSAWMGLVAIGGICLLLISRKVRAYEVVR